MTAPRPPQPPAGPERRLVPGTPPLLIAFVVVLVLGFCIALVAAVFHRGPQTCVRLYADSGRLIQQWTTDHGANTPLTGWTFEVDGKPVRAWGHLTEVPGGCP